MFSPCIEADLQPSIQFEASADNLMVRSVRNPNVRVAVTVELLEGSSFPAVEHPWTNFDFNFLLSKHDQPDFSCRGSWKECDFVLLNNTPDALLIASGINTTVSPNITVPVALDVLFAPEECVDIKYLCVRLYVGYNSSYIELNGWNNVHCQNVTPSIMCKPGEIFGTVGMFECTV